MNAADFDRTVFYGHLIKGRLTDAIGYLRQFPDQSKRTLKYDALFEHEQYITFDADRCLNKILLIYQQYYRDVLFLHMDAEKAVERMTHRFADCFGVSPMDFDKMETTMIAEAFHHRAYHFLGGKTGGYYGPYIWKETESKTYNVELPEGIQAYTVRFLDGFLSKSWLDYISFGDVSTGGWADDDGIIHCVKASYDETSEAFQVSLLKHEAQHAMDKARYPDMSSAELEYRAKLVELIYSSQRDLLRQFAHEADGTNAVNGHALASYRIAQAYSNRQGLSITGIQATARALFQKSCEELL